MKPIDFKESNYVLGGKPIHQGQESHALPVFTDGRECVSKWQLSWSERLKLLFTGHLWLLVGSGRTQPPVWLTIDFPFTVKDQKEEDGV